MNSNETKLVQGPRRLLDRLEGLIAEFALFFLEVLRVKPAEA
jgi:hypothetical protein